MTLAPPTARKLLLTAHVVFSVGWLGAVAAFLALAVVGLSGADPLRAGAAYLAMDSLASFVIVPLCIASLLSGIIQSLTTPWGLARHYWVVIKLLITAVSTLLLLIHLGPIRSVAAAAATEPPTLSHEGLRGIRAQLVVESGAALAALLVATALSVYKPSGRTRYSW